MNISPTEARDALRDIDVSADRARAFQGYRLAAPYFFIWGAVWILCYGVSGIEPRYGVIWLPATLIGMAASATVGWRIRKQAARGDHNFAAAFSKTTQTMWANFVAFGLFIAATYAILRPHEVSQLNAFPALVTGTAYALAGLWMRRYRLVAVGATIAAATVIGFFYLTPWLAFWLAAIGGGGLILTGFWMRKA